VEIKTLLNSFNPSKSSVYYMYQQVERSTRRAKYVYT